MRLLVGAIVTDGKAKVLNMLESVFALPAYAGAETFLAFYQGGVQFAEDWASAMERGLSAYRLALGDNILPPASTKTRRSHETARRLLFLDRH